MPPFGEDAVSGAALNWILWTGTVGFGRSVEERIDAAVASGCGAMSVGPLDLGVDRAPDPHAEARRIGRRARDSGLGLVFDPLMNWYPAQDAMVTPLSGVPAALSLELATEMGATTASVLGQFRTDFGDPRRGRAAPAHVSIDLLTESFARLCDDAAHAGIVLQVEFIPMSDIRDLATAWHIVRAADRPNASIIIDYWHFFLSGSPYDLLATIPTERIGAIQLNDVGRAEGTLFEQVRHRMLPGAGGAQTVRLTRQLADQGALRAVGPEVVNPDLAAMPAREAARLACAHTADMLATAGVTAPSAP